MDAQLKAKWIEALRSGEYKQCQSRLQKENSYCCLGVAAVVAGYVIDARTDSILRPGQRSLSPNDPSYVALDDFGIRNRGELIFMNDAGKSFPEIADYIEANL